MGKNEISSTEFISVLKQNQLILHKICNFYAKNKEDREDLRQEIILQLWKSFPSFKKLSKISTWIYRIALNTAITNVRKSKKHPIMQAMGNYEFAFENDKPNYSDAQINRLHQAIRRLKDIDKAIILMSLDGVSYREIGYVVGISEKYVSVKIVRIKSELKNLMEVER